MTSQSTQRLIVLLGVLLVLTFFGYTFLMGDDASDQPMSAASSPAGDDILLLVEALNKISIERTLFKSDLFLSLQDFTVDLYPEQQGRPNPFAPIGNDSVNSSQQAQPPRSVVR